MIELHPPFATTTGFKFAYRLEPWEDDQIAGKFLQRTAIGPATPFSEGAEGIVYRLLQDAIGNPFATPAYDGVTNLEKYALGMSSPFAFEPAKLPRIDSGFTFDIVSDDPDLEWRIEISNDLQTWNHNDDGQGGTPFIGRLLQRLAVDSCNRHGWVIPFTQITLHQATAKATVEPQSPPPRNGEAG